MIATPKMIGEPVKRQEDPRLITGTGKYVDDIHLPNTLHAALLRSDRAHARIKKINVDKARKMPGVVAVLTGKDIEGKVGPVPCGACTPDGKHYLTGVPMYVPPYTVLATTKVAFVGHNVAVVVANDPYTAHDALDAIEVDYDDLRPVVDAEEGTKPGAPKIHDGAPNGNIVFHVPAGPTPEAVAKVAELFKKADHKASFKIDHQRLIPMAMEPRAVLAEFDSGKGVLTVWTSTQIPHLLRTLVALLLPHPEHKLRVIAPDVGGGFGSKLQCYPEELLIPYLAKTLGRPVKWVEKRRENFTSTIHGRGVRTYVDIAFQRDGTWLAMKVKAYLDLGAHMQLLSPAIASFLVGMMTGCYKVQAASFEEIGVFTNKMATDAYRGAGRPEAALIAERCIEVISKTLKMDPADVRKKNFLTEFPAAAATGMMYDSGDYNKTLDKALEVVNYRALREEQKKARAQGRIMGVGLSSYIELCGVGPSFLGPPGVGFWEVSTVKIEPTGMVTVLTGASPHGQGGETAFAQIAAHELGVPMDNVRVIHSDTDMAPYGNGTYGSRNMATGGAALHISLQKIKEKIRQIGARLLDARPENVKFENGEVFVTSDPGRKVPLSQVVFTAYDWSWKGPGTAPTDIEPGMEATSRFEAGNLTFPFGTHICVVEIDKDTGEVKIKRFVAVDDCGTVINPLLARGQVHGGIAQGIAQALYEEATYDENGQLITGELTDYAMPKSIQLPDLETHHTVTPSPVNPLGAKGIGEAGTIGSLAAVYNAVHDALAPLGIESIEMPFKPEKIWRAIHQKTI
jgi:carbon-monoxide dehydrogenase large subunit